MLRAAGRESEADLPFVAIADLLRPLQDRITLLPGPQARALGSALNFTAPASGDRGAVNAAVLNLLGAASRERALLLLIDDYHWLDSASREVIDFVTRRAEPFGIGLVLTTRGPIPADHGDRRCGLVRSLQTSPRPRLYAGPSYPLKWFAGSWSWQRAIRWLWLNCR